MHFLILSVFIFTTFASLVCAAPQSNGKAILNDKAEIGYAAKGGYVLFNSFAHDQSCRAYAIGPLVALAVPPS
jgi:hypothetical protein